MVPQKPAGRGTKRPSVRKLQNIVLRECSGPVLQPISNAALSNKVPLHVFPLSFFCVRIYEETKPRVVLSGVCLGGYIMWTFKARPPILTSDTCMCLCLFGRYQCGSPRREVYHHLCGHVLPLLLQDEGPEGGRQAYWKGERVHWSSFGCPYGKEISLLLFPNQFYPILPEVCSHIHDSGH